ncbi:LytTR family DNA-binding domain-containing protein [Draconibacterium sp. IB214405]|uniref:LytR/AlgR family response regulator transcription factor n=1 Tax=Draconibacterium sp. IB214405 TaxID=3097352 RepID=UPI002A133108|nr:LytTR family DNA-binding domain-containing protein [Draconibacterium sp. IB214405]MDX8340177.1 LytTR family DNA-binding domain-containing protein [Draconibacterium sp. IB214405]
MNNSFSLLDRKKDRYLLVFIVAVFSIFFINVFKPWNIGRWYSDSPIIQFLRLSSYGFISSLVLLFTQFPLRKFLHQQTFKLKNYLLWILIEIVLISLVYIFLYGNPIGNFINDFLFSLKYTVLGIMIPYTFALLLIYYKKHSEEIEQLKNKLSVTDKNQLLTFTDEKGNPRFSVRSKDFLYIESTDNYVTVNFMLEGKLQRKLLRNTMKNMESQLGSEFILRCHRSFMVNTQNVDFVEKENKKLSLHLNSSEATIPVSEKYSPLLLTVLS